MQGGWPGEPRQVSSSRVALEPTPLELVSALRRRKQTNALGETHLKLGLIQQHGCGPQLLFHMLAFVVWKKAMQRGTLQQRLAHSAEVRFAVEFMSPAPLTSCTCSTEKSRPPRAPPAGRSASRTTPTVSARACSAGSWLARPLEASSASSTDASHAGREAHGSGARERLLRRVLQHSPRLGLQDLYTAHVISDEMLFLWNSGLGSLSHVFDALLKGWVPDICASLLKT